MNRTATFTLLVTGVFAAASQAGEPERQEQHDIVLKHCEVSYKNASHLGTNAIGILGECNVNLGDKVTAGQVLARLQCYDLEAQRKTKQFQAENQSVIELNEGIAANYRKRVDAYVRLLQKTTVSQYDFALVQAEALTAQRELLLSQREQQQARLELAQIESDILVRSVIAPHDGTIVAVLKRQGERVNQNETVVHLVDTRLLTVTASVDVTDVWSLKPGLHVTIRPEVTLNASQEPPTFKGRVSFIDRLIDPATQTCKVVAEVDNVDDWLKAGIDVSAVIRVE
jgi:macrolide-specific efflux system membrane fusion protein